MTVTAKATKCIAVKTPFGLMYMELITPEEYVVACGCEKSHGIYNQMIEAMGVDGFRAYQYNSEWVVTTAMHSAFLPIISNYGDQFPQ